jgi:hypothetical protein
MDTDVPSSLRQAVRRELGRAFHPPFEVPTVVVVNGALMTGAWFLTPPSILAERLGLLAFPIVLASWMYSDVPSTNLIGADALTGHALGEPALLRRMFYAKNLALWLLVTPVAGAVAIGVGVAEHRPIATAFSILWVVVVPLGALGFSALLGICYPYHELPLMYRWKHRRRWWTMLVRWFILVVTPYMLVPALTAVLTLPTLALWMLTSERLNLSKMSDGAFAAGAVLAAGLAITAWIGGHHWGTSLARRRQRWLTDFLADPDRG